jgi:hypothetical protein
MDGKWGKRKKGKKGKKPFLIENTSEKRKKILLFSRPIRKENKSVF